VSHESRLGRIEEMLADMLHSNRELPDDETLARRIAHVLTCAANADEITDETLKLVALIAPTGTADLKEELATLCTARFRIDR
jgi:hypothetical protein